MQRHLDAIIGKAALVGCVILISIVLAVLVVSATGSGRRMIVRTLVDRAGYVSGEPGDIPSSALAPGMVTVVIFAEGACPACKDAVPFLKGLREDLSRLPGASMRVLVGTNGPELTAKDVEIARAIGLPDPQSVSLRSLRLRTVPTLLVVNERGRILYANEGAPSADSEAAVHQSVLAAVTSETNRLQRSP